MSRVNLADAALQTQSDLHAAIVNDASLQPILGDPVRAYDERPEPAIYPYLTYGDMRSTDTSADAVSQTTHQITLHVWSRYDGRSEVLGLMRLITTVLETALPHRVMPLYVDAVRAPDGVTFHGLLRLSITRTEGALS